MGGRRKREGNGKGEGKRWIGGNRKVNGMGGGRGGEEKDEEEREKNGSLGVNGMENESGKRIEIEGGRDSDQKDLFQLPSHLV